MSTSKLCPHDGKPLFECVRPDGKGTYFKCTGTPCHTFAAGPYAPLRDAQPVNTESQKMNHSPTPWRVEERGGRARDGSGANAICIVDAEGRTVAVINWMMIQRLGRDRALANANLLANAPLRVWPR